MAFTSFALFFKIEGEDKADGKKMEIHKFIHTFLIRLKDSPLLFWVSHLQEVAVMDLHSTAGALILGSRRSALTGGLRRCGFPGLLLHLQLRLRQNRF